MRNNFPSRSERDTVTILSGAALSSVASLGGYLLSGIILSAGWDTAALTFFGSHDNSSFTAMLDAGGGDLIIPSSVLAASKWFAFDPVLARMVSQAPYVKLNSGTTGSAVNQTADRVITCIFERP